MVCYEIIIKGRVQGVGYRFFAQRSALKNNLKGYVKNLYNGDVKAIVIGNKADIDNFIYDLKVGPSLARVKSVSLSPIDNCKDYKDFSIIY